MATIGTVDRDGTGPLQLAAIRQLILLHGCVRGWLWAFFAVELWQPGLWAAAVVSTAALALSLSPRGAALSARLALPALLLQLWISFPTTDNHFFLELFAVALLCLDGGRATSDRELVLGALRWLTLIVLFHTGLQKLLYGQYFSGEFLAFMVGRGERFAWFFQLLLSPDEVQRLQSYDPLVTGAGPYRFVGLLPILLSNLVWFAELSLAPLLSFARTRGVAVWVAIGLVASIQLAARELGFALLFVNLLLLFTRAGNRRALPAFVCVYLYLMGAAAGLLPGRSFMLPGSL